MAEKEDIDEIAGRYSPSESVGLIGSGSTPT
jgi:hypothetical protein